MYRILIADDEGIAIDALKFIIEKNFPGECEIRSAKTGRSVIEQAESFRPDIALMDIQMPGINGIEAIKEIKKFSANTIFIVISAYDKFDYAKEALKLGVIEYVNKPVVQDKMVVLLKKAFDMVEFEKERRSNELLIKEKLEIVVPFLENSFIYAIMFQEDFHEDTSNYQSLLSIEGDTGLLMVIECGQKVGNGRFSNAVGDSVKVQSYYNDLREIVKAFNPKSIVGPVMANRVIVFLPHEPIEESREYDERIEMIEDTRKMVQKLKDRIGVGFRVGIGRVYRLERIAESYKEAISALRYAQGSVVHSKDVNLLREIEEDYPYDLEGRLFEKVSLGDVTGAGEDAYAFFSWMMDAHGMEEMDIKLKILEHTMRAETLAYDSGGKKYFFGSRHDYLEKIYNKKDLAEVGDWFVSKVREAARYAETRKEESSLSAIEVAKKYIESNYSKDLSLDDVSKVVDISPYYFSKLFKDEAGINFVDYVTGIRIEHAKQLISDGGLSIKEICAAVGYSDPNYFTRSFKKKVGLTPTEYKESVKG